jgi:hypothetical protein
MGTQDLLLESTRGPLSEGSSSCRHSGVWSVGCSSEMGSVWCVGCSRTKGMCVSCVGVRKKPLVWTEGKTGRLNPKKSREVHVGRIPSNLTAKFNLGLTLQVFETSRG